MEPWERVYITVKCDSVLGVIDGKRKRIVGRVVMCRYDTCTGAYTKILDTYVKHPDGVVVDYETRYSRLTPSLLQSGVTPATVANFFLQSINGNTLVTFAGSRAFAALGIDKTMVDDFAAEHIELQDFFKRPDGQPYGLGPLALYFGYTRRGRRIILNRNSVEDAYFHLVLFREQYLFHGNFVPAGEIMSKAEFTRMFKVY